MPEILGPSTTVFRPIINALMDLGLDWRPLLDSCGIDPDLITDSEARVSAESFASFWPKAAGITGDPCFGLHVAERVRPLAVNIIGYLLMSSPTVREGVERVARYQKLVIGSEWISLAERGDLALICLESETDHPLDEATGFQYRAGLILKYLDWITAIDFRAREARFRHAPSGEQSEYERILACPVKFRCQKTELVVSQADLDQSSLHANPEIARVHQEHAERHLAEFGDHSVGREVKTLLMSRLDRGPCGLGEVAQSLFMSQRTLQRRLIEEGTSYSEILDSLRRNLCLQHLEHGQSPLAEIAFLAGFSDASAFNRAVRRWTGQTPLEYRRSLAEEDAKASDLTP